MCWIDRGLVDWADARVCVEDRGLQFGESVYEVIPVTAGTPRVFEPHVARLERGAEALELAPPPTGMIAEAVNRLIRAEGIEEGLVYLQLTGGATVRDHVPPEAAPPTLIAYLRAHRFPRAADVERGIRVVTVPDERWGRCDLKTTMLLPTVMAKREARRRGADEALLTEAGVVREGASTSVMAVVDGALVQPAPSTARLPGTMSALVAEVAEEAGYQSIQRPLAVAELADCDEILVSATSKLVLPVVAVDDRPVGPGRAGAVAVDLAARIRSRFELD